MLVKLRNRFDKSVDNDETSSDHLGRGDNTIESIGDKHGPKAETTQVHVECQARQEHGRDLFGSSPPYSMGDRFTLNEVCGKGVICDNSTLTCGRTQPIARMCTVGHARYRAGRLKQSSPRKPLHRQTDSVMLQPVGVAARPLGVGGRRHEFGVGEDNIGEIVGE